MDSSGITPIDRQPGHVRGAGGSPVADVGHWWAIAGVLVVAVALLSIGITSDYRLKHENNNALHAAFARNHLRAGFGVTKAHDAFINPRNGRVTFYAHHPPGCGLILAGVFRATGSDRPQVVRGTAVAATLLTLILIWRLVRREEGKTAALVAAAAFSVIPQAAFYGRMVNHEVLALPAVVVLVDRYFATARGGGWRPAIAMAAASVCGCFIAWVTFFALGACAIHALLSLRRPQLYPAAGGTLGLLVALGAGLFAIDLAHIAWVQGGDLSNLTAIFARRLGMGQGYSALEWCHKMLGFSRRLFTLSGTLSLLWMAGRIVRGFTGTIKLRPIEEIAAVFLAAGLGYLVVFNWGAWQHHYWQYPLLPAVVISIALAVTTLARRSVAGPRQKTSQVVLVLFVLEFIVSSAVGLYARHTTPEDQVIRGARTFRSRSL